MEEDKRRVWDGELSRDLCRDLRFVHDCLGMRGYRARTEALHLNHVLVSERPHLALPILKAREIISGLVQDHFGLQLNRYLYLEWSGLMVWLPGSEIGWHYDSNNEDYLKQRVVSAVAYLNDQGRDFTGGSFEFEEGETRGVSPREGRVVAYFSNESNIHRVRRVESGRRYTLSLWFTDQPAHDEDAKLLKQFPKLGTGSSPGAHPVPDEMYRTEAGNDIRMDKIRALGFRVQQEGATHLLQASNGQGSTWRCESLTHSLIRALRIREGGSDEDEGGGREKTLQSAMEESWERSVELGQLYVPDHLAEHRLL
ncbi:Fe2OG dioxygenase domain-containing protein [Chloropicon primus]|uniref:procollagen-proline 3-dioxygenase n=2 Tax=Chloropicon primus TaxID=1764295 RepID=A0A5B8MHI1_9CHLO|nr:hypothetical protein A3770_03p20620 [Chloropicon primus]UPQ98756.1 Fe2OG dioxygenase domain-containing protein [Chloropicon primus]|eukprot:QDZ19544.1 hypothetical protein A3770_03p20620 [Chloropicon primus]